jgi:YesN/AraC family two-component response regulator
MSAVRILFVDDEESIRITISAVLRREAFDVSVAGSVPEALDLITKNTYDVLISDLNIGEPGDGFTVVSAMRRTQPAAVTFILTGYPDFESALRAIRSQVDDYVVKPASILSLVEAIRQRLLNRSQSHVPLRVRRTSEILREHVPAMIEQWLDQVQAHSELSAIPLSRKARIDHLPELLNKLADRIDSERDDPAMTAAQTASKHGGERFHQGYTIPLIVAESRLLQRVITATLQANLLSIDISTMIGDVIQIGESLTAELEESIRSFQQVERLAA